MAGLAENVRWLYSWLLRNDARKGFTRREAEILRIMKLAEETGEVSQAIIGTLGQNPRKGVTNSRDDIANELCDVALTALVALGDYRPDPIMCFVEFVEKNRARVENA